MTFAATKVETVEEDATLRWLWRLGPPLAVFILAHAWLWRAARLAHNNPSDPFAWGRWDTAHYLAIASHGYSFENCVGDADANSAQACGNTAWLPGYPLLLRALAALGFDLNTAGVAVSGMFALGTLLILWNEFLATEVSAKAALTLLLAGFFPGFVYQHGIFPVAQCTFFLVLSMAAYQRRCIACAGVAGAIAAFSYSSGFFLAAVFGLHLLVAERHTPWRQRLRMLLAPGLTVLGFVAFLVLLHFEVGNWKAYFILQDQYRYEGTWPWMALLRKAWRIDNGSAKLWDVQTIFVAALVLLMVGRRMAAEARNQTLLALYVGVYWLVPLSMGSGLSLYRAESLLLPGAILLHRLPRTLLIVLVLVAMLIGTRMTMLYFRNVLI